MATARVEYNGNLRTSCTHLKSGTQIQTDAPTDNNGKGEVFSPTDLMATAYASCMLTIIGIYCEQNNLSFEHGTADVTKVMENAPRRISEIVIRMDLTGNNWTTKESERILKAAEACPVAMSVHPEIKVTIEYIF
jgi:uncharacterized OsmC-like protein